MRLPRTVTIYGKQYVLKKDKTRNGACVFWETNEIIIGTAEKQNVLTNFLHEVIEQILVENHHRYENHHIQAQRGDLVFVFNHQEFENLIPQVALAIKGILRE